MRACPSKEPEEQFLGSLPRILVTSSATFWSVAVETKPSRRLCVGRVVVCEVAERKAGFSQSLVLEGRGTECLGSIPGKKTDGRAKSSCGWSPNWYVGTKR